MHVDHFRSVMMQLKYEIQFNSFILLICAMYTCRSNMERPISFYNSGDMQRKLSSNWSKEPGAKGAPLFAVPLDHVMIDELHMLLRITDRLEHGIIMDVIAWDEV